MALSTPQAVIDRARRLGYTSVGQYSDEVALEDYNIVRSELSNLIMQNVNENYFSEIIRTTWVASQNEYALTDDINNVDVNKIENVRIKYSDDWEYVRATKQNKDNLNKELDYYNENQSESNPFYYVFADSIFIYPAITNEDDLWVEQNVTNWVKLEVSLTPTELIITDTDTLFPREYTHIIALWMLYYIYQRKGLINEANNAQGIYNNAQTELIIALSDRVSVPQEIATPNLDYYE